MPLYDNADYDQGRSDRNYGRSRDRDQNDWDRENDRQERRAGQQHTQGNYGGRSRSYPDQDDGRSSYHARNSDDGARGGYRQSRNRERDWDYDRDDDYGRSQGAGRGYQRGYAGDDFGGRGARVRDQWGNRNRHEHDDHERGWGDRAADEVKSWFGDDEADRRRQRDNRGRGPKSYQRSGERIEEDVNDRLTDDSHLDASEIEVSVADREVTLSGTVSSKSEKRRAEDCAESVSGVNHVQNNLRVARNEDTYGTSNTATADS